MVVKNKITRSSNCATDKVSKQVNLPQKLQNSSSAIIKKSQELPLYLLLSNTLLPGVTRQRTNKQNLVCKQILLQATKVILELINLFLKILDTKSTTKWRTYLYFVSIDHTNTALCGIISYLFPPYRVMGKLTEDIIPLVFFGGLLIASSCTIKRIKEKNNRLGYRDLTSLSTAVTSPDACHGVSNGGMLKSRNIKLQICGTLPS
ncbi:hypothetical protein EGR_09572 [Echinococcus granulosus]|uniref:Transmembrane protein n=1 Tax=Echinococcus granulosus TaxID=6210 RepID=W6U377_ECHGR|nr:hypothetical protein EGR_09572 [Echinococcus granulosus]EUB55565.1 hypothetical protein EGR_09572 [Echinococcus granulosus]